MSNSGSMSDSSMSDGSSSREPRTTKQFERAIRNRTNRAIGTKDGHHFRHKVPVFVATKAMEEYLASGATDEQAREMQEQLITMMSDPMVGSMDPEDDNKLDSMYEAVYRSVNRHSKDRATSNAAFDDVFNKPTPSQKQLIDTHDIRSAQELRDLAGDHVQEGVDALRSMSRSGKFSSAAIGLMCAQYDKPYLNHFKPAHQEGTPNRGKILSRTLEERKLNLDMRCLSIVEAKIADRNRGARRSADDDLLLAIELSTVQESIASRRRAPQAPPPGSNPAEAKRLRRQQEEGDARLAASIQHQQEQERSDAEMAANIHRQELAAEQLRVQRQAQRQAQQQKREAEQRARDEERRVQQQLEAQRQAQQQKREAEQRARDEERRVQQQLEAQRQAQQQKREAEQRARDEERRVQQQLEAQRQAQQQKREAEQRQQYVYLQQAEMQVMAYLNYPVSHSFNSYTPQHYFSSGRSSSPSISYSSHYSSPQVHTHSVSPPGTRAGSEWDVFRSANKGLGWTRAEMSENYRNRNDF